MVVEKITRRYHADFWGEFKCEHCRSISTGQGYQDGFYYKNVLPLCKCPACGLQSRKGPVKTSYGGFKLKKKVELPEGYEPPESYYSGEPKEEGWKACNQQKNALFLY